MIALVSFALLVLIALAYVLAPLVRVQRGEGVCPACGTRLQEGAEYCTGCGARLG